MCFLRREFRKSLIFYENLSLFILSKSARAHGARRSVFGGLAMKTEKPENREKNDGFREIPDAVGNRLIVPDEILRSMNFALPEHGKQTALLLEQYRASEEYPRLGVAVRLTAPIMRKMIHICDTNYTHVLAIIVKGFVRIRKERSGGADDEATLDVRVILLNAAGAEVVCDYSLLCRYQPVTRVFDVMAIAA